MSIDIKHFQKKLLDEKTAVEKDLLEVGRKNPDNPKDWEAIAGTHDSVFEENTAGDAIDEYESHNAIVNTLEPRLRDINLALEKIKKGTYGKCEICGCEIELDRLEANPAASTCKEHKE